jgi:hypothetical protein
LGWIFDGTLVIQDDKSRFDPSYVGEPIEEMVGRVKDWLASGKDVRIFTARVAGNSIGAEVSRRAISKWSKDIFGVILPVTCVKEKDLIVLYDDKAVQVEHNTGKILSITPGGIEEFKFSSEKPHCSNHIYYMLGCADCLAWLTLKEKHETKLEKVSRIGLHPLEINPRNPGPKLQLIRQQTTRKIFIFLYNAQSDVVKAVNKKAKELNKISTSEKRDLLLAAAVTAISWSSFIEEITSDLMEAMKSGITNGLEQLAITKTTEEVDKLSIEYANKRANQMVSSNGRYSIAETTNDDLHDIIEQSVDDNNINNLEDMITEAGIFSRQRAELIAKTEIAMAQSMGNLNIWKESKKIKSVNVVVSPGHDIIDLCDEHVAKNPYLIDKAPALPIHPHCGCSLAANELVE